MTTFTTTIQNIFRKSTAEPATIDFPARQTLGVAKNPLIEIVIPVYNEALTLAVQIRELSAYLQALPQYRWSIVIADNGSQDDTWARAAKLQAELPGVRAIRLNQKGRGRALKHVWQASNADVLVYMDVDLSTDLSALEPMIKPLVSGKAVLATGSRLRKDSRVRRGFKREAISRIYNCLLRFTLGLKTSDAQCGFKAIRADYAKKILSQIQDEAWFFDTELLVKAERQGVQVHEVGVTWHEDTDSRVKISKTAMDDLKGVARLRREFSNRPRWEKYTILGILVATGLLYGIGASKNGYANSFYAAAVQAGTHSWKAFFFGSLDAGNYITVDKPPFALWVMEGSTRIFGFHSWSMLLPEVLAGIATVYLVYATVRRWFSAQSALLAAGVMVLTPVAVLMFGFNNPDAVLTLLLTGSVYAVVRALENRRPIFWLSIAGILTGCAFNTKMLQGVVVLPALALVYLLAAKPKLVIRIRRLLVAAIPLAIATLWWPLIVSTTPASSRPYIGSSTNNSVWNLILGYNGIGRLTGSGTGQGGGGMPTMGQQTGTANLRPGNTTGTTTTNATLPTQNQTGQGPGGTMGGGGGRSGPGGTGFGGSTGIFRMFNSDFGPNIAWFIPASLLAAISAVWLRRRAPRADRTRAAFLLWGGYLVLHIIVFSMVSGVIHPYYPVVMAPAVAALIGMGAPLLLSKFKEGGNAALLLPLAITLTGITACLLLGYQTTFLPWLRWVVLVGSVGSAIVLTLHLLNPLRKYLPAVLVVAALATGISPLVYSLDTATVVHTGSIPSAGPTGTGMQGSNNESASAETLLVNYLLAHKGSAKWLAAVNSANESAPLQISSGQPVMAIGGFNGGDNAMTVAQLQKLIASGQLKYYVSGSTGRGGGMGNSALTTWITAHSTKVNYGGSSSLYELHL